ncbi:cytochrome P450 [Pendulispora albinea]|uniref:Cytochrome P450 n=1 Tax=Pendulispora albinea TaxID=2741071 RepID=A0ABZ2LSS4_9BACT
MFEEKASNGRQPSVGPMAEERPRPEVSTPIARLGELRGEEPVALSADGVDLVAFHTDTGLKVFEGRCPHQGALLGEGERNGRELVCRNHRWRFDVESGRRLGGPQCLRACPSQVRNGIVYADLRALRTAAPAASLAHTRSVQSLPGPPGLPLLGNLLSLDPSQLHRVLEGWEATYGSLFRFRLGTRDVVVVSEPALVQKVLRERPENYRRMSTFAPVFEEIGAPGVLSAEGKPWRSLRRLTMEALSHRHLKSFYPTLKGVVQRLHTRWSRAADAGREVHVTHDLQRFLVDVMTRLAFGYDVNALEGGDGGERRGEISPRQFDEVFDAVNRRLIAPFPYWRFVRLPADRKLERIIGQVFPWISRLVDAARERIAEDPGRAEQPQNFLEAMICARDDAGQPFSNEVILGNALQILAGGQDTTANTLAWAIHEICDRPDVVASLRKELDRALGDDAMPESIETAGRLVYATAIANEVMRLRPVVPSMFMEANTDVVLGDLALPKGTATWVLVRPAARDAENFADPESFRPERWLAQSDSIDAHDTSAYAPFGSGPRICPGRTLALLEMRVALAMIFRNFEIVRTSPRDIEEVLKFTMNPRDLRVRLRRRAAA